MLRFALTEMKLHDYYKQISKDYRTRYNDWFKGKYRLYFPFTPQYPEFEINPKISDALKAAGYKVKDYSAGIATNGKEDIRIGRLLQKYEPVLVDVYKKDRNNLPSISEPMMIVITRNPADILKQSTKRSWTSCKDLIRAEEEVYGTNHKYIPSEIEQGCLIAYVIRASDKNIKYPISRILIIPYFNPSDPTDSFLYPMEKIYGVQIDNFRSEVEKHLEKFQGKIGTVYCSDLKNFYQDEQPDYLGNLEEQKKLVTKFIDNNDGYVDEDGYLVFRDASKLLGIYDIKHPYIKTLISEVSKDPSILYSQIYEENIKSEGVDRDELLNNIIEYLDISTTERVLELCPNHIDYFDLMDYFVDNPNEPILQKLIQVYTEIFVSRIPASIVEIMNESNNVFKFTLTNNGIVAESELYLYSLDKINKYFMGMMVRAITVDRKFAKLEFNESYFLNKWKSGVTINRDKYNKMVNIQLDKDR